jgi:hypothetical protein
VSVGNLPALQGWDFDYVSSAFSSSAWVAASSGGYVYFTNDFFVSNPIDKRGNILTINPIAHLDLIKVVP